jgi:hypothetical protein
MASRKNTLLCSMIRHLKGSKKTPKLTNAKLENSHKQKDYSDPRGHTILGHKIKILSVMGSHDLRTSSPNFVKCFYDKFTWIIFFVNIVQKSFVWTIWRRNAFAVSRICTRACTFFSWRFWTLSSSPFLQQNNKELTQHRHLANLHARTFKVFCNKTMGFALNFYPKCFTNKQ